MRSQNEIRISGTVVRDFSLHKFDSGSRVSNGELVVSRGKAGDYPQVKGWGEVAQALAGFGSKGRFVFVDGVLRTELYPDPQDSSKQRKLKSTYILARHVKILDATSGEVLAEAEETRQEDEQEAATA